MFQAPLPSEQPCRRFSLAEIHSATQNFDDALVLGQGGFGKVYKGFIDDGANTVAIKRLNSGSMQGATEFWTEIEMLSKFRHCHLVSLIGYCDDCLEMILVYEYMVHGSLADHLHKTARSGKSTLSWVQRLKICIGAARGLDYLHTGMDVKHRVIHRDVKSSNILLDVTWAAKISDFGLSKIGPANQSFTHVSTNVRGTYGYLDPQYFLTGKLTRKSDVYAFGVVLFEVLCGRQAVDLRLDEEQWGLVAWAQHCIKEGTLDQIIDPSLKGQILSSCLTAFVEIAEQCLRSRPRERPTMVEVVACLEFALALQETTGQEVIHAGNGGHQDKKIGLITGVGDPSSGQSRVMSAKKVTFVRKVWQFFAATPRVFRIAFTTKANYGKEDKGVKLASEQRIVQGHSWATEHKTLQGLQSTETTMQFSDKNTYSKLSQNAEEAKQRAEIARLRDLHTLKDHVESVFRRKGLDIDMIQQQYSI